MYNGYDKLIQKYDNYRKSLPEILEREILEETANVLQSNMRKRIFTDGLDSHGELIGTSYGSKPINVEKKVFIKPSSFRGKKTMHLEHGYKELREIQGLQTNKVDLRYSGDLRESMKVRRKKNYVVIGFSEKYNAEKAKKLQLKYNRKIFRPTSEETINHLQLVVKKLRKVQRKYFYGE